MKKNVHHSKRIFELFDKLKIKMSLLDISTALSIDQKSAYEVCERLVESSTLRKEKIEVGSTVKNVYFLPNDGISQNYGAVYNCVRGTRSFTNSTPMSGEKAAGVFLCDKELIPSIAPKPYIPPKNNPNYTPSGRTFLTSGRGFFNGVKA